MEVVCKETGLRWAKLRGCAVEGKGTWCNIPGAKGGCCEDQLEMDPGRDPGVWLFW